MEYDRYQKFRQQTYQMLGKAKDATLIQSKEYVLVGIDHTAWGRKGAKTLKDRTYEHQASSNNSVTVGQGYSTIVWIPEKLGSWALPLRHERITSFETPISKATWQLKQVTKHIKQKVLVVLDSEYGNGSWVNQTGEIPVNCIGLYPVLLQQNNARGGVI